MNSVFLLTASLILTSAASNANSQIMVNPTKLSKGSTLIEGGLSFADIEYAHEGSNDVDVDRKIIFAGISTPLSSSVDLMGQFGFIIEAEFEGVQDEGTGWVLGFGPKFVASETTDYRIFGNLFLNAIKESYDLNVGELEVAIWDLQASATVEFIVSSSTIKPYAGIDLLLKSDGEVAFGSIKSDIEKDDLLNLKFGATLNLDSVAIRPEATIFGDQTFTLAFSAR